MEYAVRVCVELSDCALGVDEELLLVLREAAGDADALDEAVCEELPLAERV